MQEGPASAPIELRQQADGSPYLDYGIGLRRPHFDELVQSQEGADFFEILVENYMGFGGRPRKVLQTLLQKRPFVLHGVGLSIGGPDPLNEDYLAKLEQLIEMIQPPWFSDHLCYSRGFGVEYHDLIPLPFTQEALDRIVSRVHAVQERFKIPLALENPSYYVTFESSTMSEAQFINELVRRTDCKLLLDVNNVYVNSQNHGYDPVAFIDAMPATSIAQLHMAGHTRREDIIIDTHGAHIVPEVFDLYAHTLRRFGPISTLLEWDNNIPSLATLLEENEKLRTLGENVLRGRRP